LPMSLQKTKYRRVVLPGRFDGPESLHIGAFTSWPRLIGKPLSESVLLDARWRFTRSG
jgi:hypothetical protein